MTDILVVDDEPGMLETLTDLLEEFGYTVETANNGKEAIEKVKANPFDIVFMDIKMPGINGVETFRQLKKIRPGIVVMMMTAYSVEQLIDEAIQEGAKGIMHKPIQLPRVLEFIESIESGSLILIVDDDPATCETLIDVLNEKGFRTLVAYDGEESFRLVREKSPDVVFIDMKLPLMNGLEVYKKIREIDPEIKAVMMTGYQYEVAELVEQAVKMDAFASLYKPFDIDYLIQVIEGIISEKTG